MRRPVLALVAVCLTWGTIPSLIAPIHLPPATITAARVWLAAIGLGVALAVRRTPRPVPGGPPLVGLRRRVALAGGLLAVHWTCQFAAYQRAPAPTVAFVIFLAPVGVAALAPIVLGERTPPRALVALAVAVAGAALVSGPALGGASATGLALAAASAVSFVALTVVRKPLAVALGGLRATLAESSVAAALLAPAIVGLLAGGDGPAHPAWAWLLVLGLVHTAVLTATYLWALARVPATTASILGELEPVGVVVCAAVAGHAPGAATLAGGGLVLAAGAVVALARTTPTLLPLEPVR